MVPLVQLTPLVTIAPPRRFPPPPTRELWAHRELLYFLVWRDVKVRYKQTLLGGAWAILQPLATAAVFTLFFGRVAGVASDGLPYSIFSYCGLLLWLFFAQALAQASQSLVGSSNLITKVYFPRLVIPVAPTLAGLLDFVIASPLLAALMAFHGVRFSPRLLLFPIPVALAVVTAVGAGLWLAALNVEYRDIRYVIPFLIQLWLFCSPVIYPASSVLPVLAKLGIPGWVFGLNPMAVAIEGFRWAVLGLPSAPPPAMLMAGVASALAVLISGMVYFAKVERWFADVV